MGSLKSKVRSEEPIKGHGLTNNGITGTIYLDVSDYYGR
jgi:hypothetical protein